MRLYRDTIKVSWAHCDAAGIVFYPHFYTWFDQATRVFAHFCGSRVCVQNSAAKTRSAGPTVAANTHTTPRGPSHGDVGASCAHAIELTKLKEIRSRPVAVFFMGSPFAEGNSGRLPDLCVIGRTHTVNLHECHLRHRNMACQK